MDYFQLAVQITDQSSDHVPFKVKINAKVTNLYGAIKFEDTEALDGTSRQRNKTILRRFREKNS